MIVFLHTHNTEPQLCAVMLYNEKALDRLQVICHACMQNNTGEFLCLCYNYTLVSLYFIEAINAVCSKS